MAGLVQFMVNQGVFKTFNSVHSGIQLPQTIWDLIFSALHLAEITEVVLNIDTLLKNVACMINVKADTVAETSSNQEI